MGLNIVATRKYDLAGFGEGWDGAYLIVKVPNSKDRQTYLDDTNEIGKKIDAETAGLTDATKIDEIRAKYDAIAEEKVFEATKKAIVSGEVVNTKEDGSVELVKIEPSDISYVVDSLGFFWCTDILSFAFGTNGLKAKN